MIEASICIGDADDTAVASAEDVPAADTSASGPPSPTKATSWAPFRLFPLPATEKESYGALGGCSGGGGGGCNPPAPSKTADRTRLMARLQLFGVHAELQTRQSGAGALSLGVKELLLSDCRGHSDSGICTPTSAKEAVVPGATCKTAMLFSRASALGLTVGTRRDGSQGSDLGTCGEAPNPAIGRRTTSADVGGSLPSPAGASHSPWASTKELPALDRQVSGGALHLGGFLTPRSSTPSPMVPGSSAAPIASIAAAAAASRNASASRLSHDLGYYSWHAGPADERVSKSGRESGGGSGGLPLPLHQPLTRRGNSGIFAEKGGKECAGDQQILTVSVQLPSAAARTPVEGRSSSEPQPALALSVHVAPLHLRLKPGLLSDLAEAFSVFSEVVPGLTEELAASACRMPTREARLLACCQTLGFKATSIDATFLVEELVVSVAADEEASGLTPCPAGSMARLASTDRQRRDDVDGSPKSHSFSRGDLHSSSEKLPTEALEQGGQRVEAVFRDLRLNLRPPAPSTARSTLLAIAQMHRQMGGEQGPVWSVGIDGLALTALGDLRAMEEAEEALLFVPMVLSIASIQVAVLSGGAPVRRALPALSVTASLSHSRMAPYDCLARHLGADVDLGCASGSISSSLVSEIVETVSAAMRPSTSASPDWAGAHDAKSGAEESGPEPSAKVASASPHPKVHAPAHIVGKLLIRPFALSYVHDDSSQERGESRMDEGPPGRRHRRRIAAARPPTLTLEHLGASIEFETRGSERAALAVTISSLRLGNLRSEIASREQRPPLPFALPLASAAIESLELRFSSAASQGWEVALRLHGGQVAGFPENPGCFLMQNRAPVAPSDASADKEGRQRQATGKEAAANEADLPLIALSYRSCSPTASSARASADSTGASEAPVMTQAELHLELCRLALGVGLITAFLPTSPPPPASPATAQTPPTTENLALGFRINLRDCFLIAISEGGASSEVRGLS